MFVSQIAPLTAALSLDNHGVGGGLIGAPCVHTLHMLTLLEPTDDLRTPEKHRVLFSKDALDDRYVSHKNIKLLSECKQKY